MRSGYANPAPLAASKERVGRWHDQKAFCPHVPAPAGHVPTHRVCSTPDLEATRNKNGLMAEITKRHKLGMG